MGKFNGKISAEFTPPKTWVLEKGLSFITEDLTDAEIDCLKEVGANIATSGRVTCKKGMHVPQLFMTIFMQYYESTIIQRIWIRKHGLKLVHCLIRYFC